MELAFTAIDFVIISGCIKKNRDDQRKLYELTAPVIYAKILQDGYMQKEAEEVLKRVFIEIFNSIEKYDKEDLFEDWCIEVYQRVKILATSR